MCKVSCFFVCLLVYFFVVAVLHVGKLVFSLC